MTKEKNHLKMLSLVLEALANTNEMLRESDSILDGFAEIHEVDIPRSTMPALNDTMIAIASMYLAVAEAQAEEDEASY